MVKLSEAGGIANASGDRAIKCANNHLKLAAHGWGRNGKIPIWGVGFLISPIGNQPRGTWPGARLASPHCSTAPRSAGRCAAIFAPRFMNALRATSISASTSVKMGFSSTAPGVIAHPLMRSATAARSEARCFPRSRRDVRLIARVSCAGARDSRGFSGCVDIAVGSSETFLTRAPGDTGVGLERRE